MGKSVRAVSIISGVDGPTSVFVVGRKHNDKNIFIRMKSKRLNRKYKKKKVLAEKSIVPGAHTMEETIQYMKQKYGAVEVDFSYPYYKNRKRDSKHLLIRREKPELLGEDVTILPPEDLSDGQAVREWQREIDEWDKECKRKVDLISNVEFPTDYHLFIINKGENGKMEVEIDVIHHMISISYSGKQKIMNPISKDIHLYYGVSGEDIDQKTNRYQMLVTALSY